MKDFKNDSASMLARFGRDKREQTERRPRSQRDAADSERFATERRPRNSYNPNFTADNRPVREERPAREERPRRSFDREENRRSDYRSDRGSEGRYRREEHSDHRFGNRRNEYGDHADHHKKFDKPFGAGRSEEKGRGSFPRRERSFGEHRTDDRRTGGYGHKESGHSFGGHRSAEQGGESRRFGNRSFDKHRAGERSEGGRSGRRSYERREGASGNYPKYNPNKQTGEMRLNRYIAQSGICSRREADDFILAGLVTVNGEIVTELGTKVLPTDEVKFNDSRVEGEKKVYLVLNKPKGFVTSLEDPHADKTVMDLVKDACTERIYPVGRLDKNSVGLLLFTNDGDLTRQLTHPSFQKKKIYQVSLDKPLTRADMDRIAEGITLEDGLIFADEIAYVKEDKQEVGIEIHSGRNRIVRRIFEHLGYAVKKLDRVYYAGLSKKNLKRGQWRFLTREEVQRLKSGQYE
ncbi:MAG: pseudouridine synthase [Alistipes sp.]|nr:pseudouridine synthase [Alistipes sp.]